MAERELKHLLSEDVISWMQSVVKYVKETQASCLDMRTVPVDTLDSENIGIQPIFYALEGSEVTEIHLGRKNLNGKMQNYFEILGKTKIKKLNLEYCKMTIDDFLSLMAILKNTQTTELDLSENSGMLEEDIQIRRFVTSLMNSRLTSLSLAWNSLLPIEKESSVLFESLPNTRITCLDLSGFFYGDDHSSHEKRTDLLCMLMSKLEYTVITDLNLGWNKFDDILAITMGDVLGKTKLKKLNLRNNKLTDSGVDVLVPGLIRSNITHLNLSKNLINGDNNLGHCLRNTKISEIDLSKNPISNERMFSGRDLLQGSAVDVLKLSDCFDPNKTVHLHIKELKFSELIYLDLSGISLKSEHAFALADVLNDSKLTHISLRGSKLSEKSFGILGDCLTKSKLKYINLRFTAQFTNNIRAVASFLDKTKNSALVSLNLRNNDLSHDFDIIALALANTTFLSLDLEANHCKTGIVSLAEQLKFTAISELNLNYNDIGDDGAVVLANCLEETQIIQLSLCHNSITSRGAEAFALVLKKTKLRQLDLRNNKIEDDGLKSLANHAKNSCITCINVRHNPGDRKLLIDRVMWENRTKIQIFGSLLKRTAFFTGDSNIFEFDRNFDEVDIDAFIVDCLQLYKCVAEEPFIVVSIEQDKCISDLKHLNRFYYDSYSYLHYFDSFVDEDVDIFIEDCSLIYRKVLEQSCPIQTTVENGKLDPSFTKKILWLILEEFPRKLVSFIGRCVEADVTQHVLFLRKIEELGLTGIVELLLLNRPLYVIEENQNVLHPFVYELLRKYKQPICNTDIEPRGVEKIIEYFTKHIDIDGASEVISLLCDCESQ